MGLFASICVLLTPPLRNLFMRMGKIPKQGMGPTVKQMEQGYLRVVGEATGVKGTRVSSVIYFDVDSGYRDTSRMLFESGMTMAKDGAKLKCPGGVYTPGFALGEVLLERLCKTGTRFALKIADGKTGSNNQK